jgi:hypothetical protein
VVALLLLLFLLLSLLLRRRYFRTARCKLNHSSLRSARLGTSCEPVVVGPARLSRCPVVPTSDHIRTFCSSLNTTLEACSGNSRYCYLHSRVPHAASSPATGCCAHSMIPLISNRFENSLGPLAGWRASGRADGPTASRHHGRV